MSVHSQPKESRPLAEAAEEQVRARAAHPTFDPMAPDRTEFGNRERGARFPENRNPCYERGNN